MVWIMVLKVEVDYLELSMFLFYRFKKQKLGDLKYFFSSFTAEANYKTVSVFCLTR